MKLKIVWLLSCLTWVAACGGSDDETPTVSTDPDASDDTETDTGEPADAVYSVTVDGDVVYPVRVAKFDVPVNYVHMSYTGSEMSFEVTPKTSFSDFTLSPKSKGIEATASGDTISFKISEPVYLILQIPDHERLLILVDPTEEDAPSLDDANVKNIMDYEGIDNTGETDLVDVIQQAIDEASGAARNILYFPKGTYASSMLYLRDDMTLYLAEGAVLKNVTPQSKLMSHPSDLTVIEVCSRGFIVMNGISNAKLKGRGTIDGNGAELQSFNRKMFLVKIENSSNCEIEGIISRDSCFWNTVIYRSDNISIENYKVINNRLDGDWNETDGVDFNNCTNSTLSNAFLYTGDDCMAVKADDIPDGLEVSGIADPTVSDNYINVDNILHEHVVCFSASSGCKVGTKTFGETMSNITFRDIDVVTGLRGLAIDAVDTANIIGTRFEDIRIEAVGGDLVDFNMDSGAISWRTNLGTCTVTDTSVIDVAAEALSTCVIEGNVHDYSTPEKDPYFGNEYFVDGVSFQNFSIAGNVIQSLDDPNAAFSVNDYATNITFE